MGLWHAGLLARVARALEARGARCVFALADPVLARLALGPVDSVVPAPVYVPTGGVVPTGVSTKTFADILGGCGWHAPQVIGALMQSWDALLALIRPDVLVADHAPTLLLAARGRVPRVTVGLGFTSPPAHLERFPDLHDGPPGSFPEADVLEAVNSALGGRGSAPLQRLPAALDAEASFVTVMDELDPYRPLRRGPGLGPLGEWPPPTPLPERHATFAYLAADDPRTVPLLTALAASGPVRAFVRRVDGPTRAALLAAGVTLDDRPADVPAALREAALVVHHGGAGLTHDAVLAGRPQLLLPRHLEQQWNAHAVVRHGAGSLLSHGVDNEAVRTAVASLSDPKVARTAALWADVTHAQLDPDAASVIAERSLELA